MTSTTIFNLTTIAYFVTMVCFFGHLVSRSSTVGLVATTLAWSGFSLNSGALVMRWLESKTMGFGHAPFTNLYESVVFFCWAILLLYLFVDIRYKLRSLGAFVLPMVFFGMTWAQISLNDIIEPLVPALQSNWLTYHVISCFFGYAAFAIAFGASVMYLIQSKLLKNRRWRNRFLLVMPSIQSLDDISYRTIIFGFVMLTLGIVSGAAWAKYAWGTYWSWDPKETWSLIVWFIYAAFIHARLTRGWRGNRAAGISIAGFAATIFCYLGVNLLLSGLHSYAS